jgi:bacteriorhodopsin
VELIALMLLLLALALATLPMWPYSARWTYYPCGSCALAVAVIVYLTLEGRL